MSTKKRDNGTGSIYVDGNKYVAAIQIGLKSNGKPKIKKFNVKEGGKELAM